MTPLYSKARTFDKDDSAEAYWFANVNVSPENAGSLVGCPTASTGSDAP